MDTELRFLLPAYLVAYFGLAIFWRSFQVWRKAGLNPYRLGLADDAHDFVGRSFGLIAALTAAVVLVYSFLPGLYPYLLPLTWLERPALVLAGGGLLLASLVWILVAQAQMGNSWRIGIDTAHKTELVQGGLYRFSRNPIFLGMRATLLGLFLVLPNALTLLILALGDALAQIQVRLEEEHLGRTHGENYYAYCRRVRRWI